MERKLGEGIRNKGEKMLGRGWRGRVGGESEREWKEGRWRGEVGGRRVEDGG